MKYFYVIEFTRVSPMISTFRDGIEQTMESARKAKINYVGSKVVTRISIWSVDEYGITTEIAIEYERK